MSEQARNRDHLTQMIAGAMAPIAKEMYSRMEGDLSRNDELAVSAALVKAASEGARMGAAEVVAQVSEAGRSSVRLHLHQHIDDYDPWVEEFGAEGDGD